MALFFTIVFTVWGLVLTHVYCRTRSLLGLRGRCGVWFGVVFFLVGFSYIPARILLSTNQDGGPGAILTYLASVVVGLVAILWTLIFAFDLGSAAVWLATGRRIRNASLQKRRTAVKLLWSTAAGLAVVGMLTAYSTPGVTRIQVTAPGVETTRLAVFSDTHLGAVSSENQWRRTLGVVRRLEPDAILIPGDLVDDNSNRAAEQVSMLRDFFPSEPVYVSSGNHDFYSGLDWFGKLCERFHFRLLRQEAEEIIPGLTLVGIDDAQVVAPDRALAEVLPRLNGPVILLSHRPGAASVLRTRQETLVLSGHTHGGQTLPMVLLVALANGGFRSGYYQVGEAHLYLSNGAGVWGPPMRLFAQPEVLLLEVQAGQRFQIDR
jgi:predicted MPP superfamily phosphohydrolase